MISRDDIYVKLCGFLNAWTWSWILQNFSVDENDDEWVKEKTGKQLTSYAKKKS